uniref:Capsid protein n=1 Tax=Ambidensovirus sp. TaxID=2050976 RepID=A0A2P1G6A8_9VIRU|nr:capsid protein [Ambidensovirus sp.]
MADSTTDYDMGESSRKRKRDTNGGGSGSGIGKGNNNSVKEGYGPNMQSMVPRNIFNKGNHSIYHVVKNQKYLDVNFVTNQNPYIIPYHMAGFWGSMWDSTNILDNNTISIMKALNAISIGVTWIKGIITFELYSVCRQRLLTGTTSQTTWDFETSQNLFIADADREPETYDVASSEATGPLNQQTKNTSLFNANNDRYTKYELPQRHMYTREINFEELHNNYMWKPVDFSNAANYRTMIPTAEGVEITTKANTKIEELTQENDAYATSKITTKQSTFRNRTSHPRMHIAQPYVPDETGFMKFRYQVRMSTELHLNFHLLPDYGSSTQMEYFKRQTLQLPQIADKGTVICMPYEINV